MKTLIALLLFTASHAALAVSNPVVDSLLASLKCEGGDSAVLDAFRDLEGKEGLKELGIEVTKTGEEMDERIKVKSRDALELYGTKSNAAEMYIDGGDFIVSSTFRGNADEVIAKMNLKRGLDRTNKNDYVNQASENDCPPTVRLRKMSGKRFRFGCGWCNG